MKSNSRWRLCIATVAGCVVQYWWLQRIPASAHHAVGVVLVTAVCNLFLALRMAHPRSTSGRWFYLFNCAFVGTIAASTSYWAMELLDVPEAAINTLSKSLLSALGMTALLTGGWFVGLLSGLVNLLPKQCARPHE